MKNKLKSLFEYKWLEYYSYLLMIIWAVSPIIEYILRFYIKKYKYFYFEFSIYFVGILGFIIYFIYIYKKIKDKKINIKDYIPHILILILLIISLISSIFSSNSRLSFYGEGFRKEGLFVYIMYIGFILSSSIIKDKKYIFNIFKVIILSSLFITILPFFNEDFTYKNFPNIYWQFNHYGYFLMISTILSAFMFVNNKKVKKIIYLIIYIYLLYILIRNNTFGCYLALFISLLCSLLYSLIKKYKRRDIVIIFITFILASFLISKFNINIGDKVESKKSNEIITNNINTFKNDINTIIGKDKTSDINKVGTGRGRLWKLAFNYTIEHPILGGGMECLKIYYRDINIHYSDRPHNIILQTSSFIGIPGALIYLALILYLAIINLKNLKNNSVNIMIYFTAMCYFISSNFGNSMFYTSPYFMILLGLLIGMQIKRQ